MEGLQGDGFYILERTLSLLSSEAMPVNSDGSRIQMGFWDGTESMYTRHSLTPSERKNVWDAVAGYVQHELMMHKGVRIPTLGSFDMVQTETLVGNKSVILQRPVFHLARNIGEGQNLENKDDLTGDKQLEPLKYARVAMEASVSRRKVESCVLGTTSLLHHCLDNGLSVAFVLNDVGVLLIKGSKVQMRFYLDFLQKLMGGRIQDRATLKALQQLDMVVSREAPITSLSSNGRVIIFPNFEDTFPSTSLSRDHLKHFGFLPGEDKSDITGFPPIRRGMEGTIPGLPVPAHQGSTAKAGEQPRDGEEMETRVRKLPVVPGAGRKQPEPDQAQGKPGPKGQASKQSDKEATATQRDRGGRGERKDFLSREGEKKVQFGKEGERKESLGSEGEKSHLGRDGEKKVQLGKEGEKRETLGREGEKARLERNGEKKVQFGKKGERRESLGREGEKARLGRNGEKKVQFGKEEERRESLEGEKEKARLGRNGEKKVQVRKEGERRESLGREGEKKVQLGKEGERRESLGGEEKARVGRNEGKKDQLGKEGERRESLEVEKQNASLGRDAEKKVQLGKEREKARLGRNGERRDSLRREGERRDSLRRGERRDSSRREGESRDSLRREESRNSLRRGGEKVLRGREKDAVGSEGEKKAQPKRGENKVSPRRRGEKEVFLGRGEKIIIGKEGVTLCLKRGEVKYLFGREREKRLVCGREGEMQVPAWSTRVPWAGQARKPQDSKVFILQQRGAEAAQALRARPEAFWSVLKEPQKSILAGYRFECSRLLPPLSLQGTLPMLKKREMVSRGPWPWVE